MRKRHVWIYHVLTPLVIAFLFIRFGYRFKKARNLPDKYIVLANHTTDFDPLFVAASFPRQMYFVASEHIARWKNAYKFIRYALAPILRYKGSVAVSTVREVLQRLRDGANICIFAEGARTWDGVTAPFLPSTGKLIKAAGCGLVTYKITGGYFVSPNWSEKSLRRGPISGAPVRVYSPEEIEKMTVDEINRAIAADLHEDAYARQMANPQPYKGKKLAHRMENLLFICPQCGEMDTIRSTGNHMECMKCTVLSAIRNTACWKECPFRQ
ncbi:MAG: 1-acyl-sn-glycerol-3-phosphate acyltransferase [Clostridia bacterium]|nr:1-acyl-sn-glycerol-3-phosphate acyltransferase [Clostridia bacterium]